MGLFSRKSADAQAAATDSAALAQRSLDFIAEGVLLVDERGMIRFVNPAAAQMTGYDSPENITGLDYALVIRLETSEEIPVEITQSKLYTALMTNQAMTTREYLLVSAQSEHRIAVALSCIPTGGTHNDRIITFRDITKELAEEREQAEFISTASHEMRTPVASIEGYLGLALNPQTATIDARAKQYLEAAHAASQHLGRLFKDLLDVTKLDDSREKIQLVPLDAIEAVKHIAGEHEKEMQAKHLQYNFGATKPALDKKRLAQKVYMAVDYDFLREIIDNLVGNAIKYTPEGGEILVNVRGDGDKVLISVADTGIGVAPDDINHIFQKFYRVDNSQTRQIGGTGLGLYLVKQRVEALGGRVWAESSFGKGSTFYVSLPRISDADYERMRIAHENERMVRNFSAGTGATPNSVSTAAGSLSSAVGSMNTSISSTDSGLVNAAPVASEMNPASAGVVSAPGSTPTMTPGQAVAAAVKELAQSAAPNVTTPDTVANVATITNAATEVAAIPSAVPGAATSSDATGNSVTASRTASA